MLPERVKIGGTVYAVVEVDREPHVHGYICGGSISYRRSEIEIHTPGVSADEQQITLWHEVIHGVADDRGIQLNGSSTGEDKRVDSLARGWYAFCVDNRLGPGRGQRALPSAVKVGGVTFVIHYAAGGPLISDDENVCAAWIDRYGGIIHVATEGYSRQCQELMLLHMIVKAIVVDRGIELPDDDGETIRALAGGLHAFIVDNDLAFPDPGS